MEARKNRRETLLKLLIMILNRGVSKQVASNDRVTIFNIVSDASLAAVT